MPAIVSHVLLADKIYAELCGRCPRTDINYHAFIWGASGPDLLFTHALMPWNQQRSLRTYGTKMHRSPADVLLNYLLGYARVHDDALAMSYALGFITHYAYDAAAHPFILYFSDVMSCLQPRKSSSVCHNEIEAALDTIMLRKNTGVRISRLKLSDMAPLDPPVNEAIAGALQSYLLFAFDRGAYRSELIRAQKDWHNSLAALNDRTGLKRQLIRQAERLVHLPPLLSPMFRRDYPVLSSDPANIKHAAWFDAAAGRERTESFFDLTAQAETHAAQLIDLALSGHRLPAELRKRSFAGK